MQLLCIYIALPGSREERSWQHYMPSRFPVLQTSVVSSVSSVVHKKLKCRFGKSFGNANRNHIPAQAQGSSRTPRNLRIIWFLCTDLVISGSFFQTGVSYRHLGF